MLRPEETRARSEVGVLLASTVREQLEGDQPLCRWLLAHREDAHGRVRAWLEDVLREARRDQKAVGDLPFNLSGQERFHSWRLPLLGAPPPGDDQVDEPMRVFRAAIEQPLSLAHDDGTPRYRWRFAAGGAERLARAFAEERLQQPDAPLAPELQVVLARLLAMAGNGVSEIAVREDPEELITTALTDHLRDVLKDAFPAAGKAAAQRGRARALLALQELADAQDRREEGISSRLIKSGGGWRSWRARSCRQ